MSSFANAGFVDFRNLRFHLTFKKQNYIQIKHSALLMNIYHNPDKQLG